MASIPAELQVYTETVVRNGLAHRPKTTTIQVPTGRAYRGKEVMRTEYIHHPACDPGSSAIQALTSAAFAHLNGATACEHEACFGPVLAAPPPEWRRIGPPQAALIPAATRKRATTRTRTR